jgi:endonuclease YncB( thermonuclease family)
MMKKIVLAVTVTALLFAPGFAQAKGVLRTVEGTVVKVTDGDTINVQNARGTKLKIRLYGIDAPETEKSNKRTGHVSKPGQPYGEQAFRTLEGLLYHKKVTVEVMDRDRYHRLVALVWLGGKNINQEMVAEGYAWAYKQYLDTPYASEFIRLEEMARKKRLGLWSRGNPQPPWEFRRFLNKNKRSKDTLKGKTRNS